MRSQYSYRYLITGVAFIVVFALLAGRLFDLQFNNGETYLEKAQQFSRKPIRLTGPRGKILDRNGLPLAYNKTSYSVEFVRNPSLASDKARESYTPSILQTIRIVEQNGGTFLSTFAIRKMEDGTFDFSWPGVEKDSASYKTRVTDWKNLFCSTTKKIYKDHTPEQIFNECRTYYKIPADASYDEAYKALSVWQEMRTAFYKSYLPITLAEGVSMKAVAMIERNAIDLPGMQISQSESRVYPNKSMAAHIIGYMGRMDDEPTIVDMVQKGYTRDDLVGKSGIEASQELQLSGNTNERTGLQVVEVNNLGKVSRVIESDNKTPKPGNNVILTIDSKLQKRVEELLAENIAQVRAAQETQYREHKDDKYDFYLQDRIVKQINYAQVGAAVVMDVRTGEILAMASYPSFDLNIFNGGLGITDADFALLNSDKRNPLFNNAITSKGTPGSVFKMCTGLAGLSEEVITPEMKISDGGYYNNYVQSTADHGPSCWVRPYFNRHADLTIVDALKYSCNYFFFTVADGLGINRLNNWADKLGLTTKTNVELPNEATSQIGSQENLYSKGHMSGVAALVRNKIVALMREVCGKAGIKNTDDAYTQATLHIMDLVNAGIKEKGTDIRTTLKNELKLMPADITKNPLDTGNTIDKEISAYLTEIEWNGNMTIETGIGQSVTMVTPIAMARYVAALVNGGDVFEARIVKSIVTPDGQVNDTQPKLIRNLGVPQTYLDTIKEGMRDVVSEEEGGTAASMFKDFKYVTDMGAKTGTAQVNQNIDLENNSWFVAFAPLKKPEIAIAVYIPNGYQGALSGYTAREIIKYYLDVKYQEKIPDVLPQVNTLVK